MAKKKELTRIDRVQFAAEKSQSALKWLLVSGVATYALLEIAKVLGGIEGLTMYAPIIMLVINISTFAIAKYNEGEN